MKAQVRVRDEVVTVTFERPLSMEEFQSFMRCLRDSFGDGYGGWEYWPAFGTPS